GPEPRPPAANSAAATVSPARAGTSSPSTAMVTVPTGASGSRLNIEPPRAEHIEIRREAAGGDHRWQHERMGRRQRNAAVARRKKGTRPARRFVVDRESVLGHHPESRPGAHDVERFEQWEHSDGAARDRGGDAEADALVEAGLFLGIAEHDRALVGLADGAQWMLQE